MCEFTYHPYVLIRPYRHFTFVALIGPRQIMYVSHNISTIGFGDSAQARRMDTPIPPAANCQKQICHPSKVSCYSTIVSHSQTNIFAKGCYCFQYKSPTQGTYIESDNTLHKNSSLATQD